MEKLFLEYATQSIFCCLFIYTYLNNQRVNKEREEKYIATINNFSIAIEELKEAISKIDKRGDKE